MTGPLHIGGVAAGERSSQIAESEHAAGADRAARIISLRFGLPLHRAALLCELNGLGPQKEAA